MCANAQLADLSPLGDVRVLSALQPEGGDAVSIRFETLEEQKVEVAGASDRAAGRHT